MNISAPEPTASPTSDTEELSTFTFFSYDENGNMISDGTFHYTYNTANQMTLVRLGDKSGPIVEQCWYDHSKNRIKKVECHYPQKHLNHRRPLSY